MQKSWKILIVDDEQIVHKVTELALKEYTIENRHLQFLSAYSKSEAQTILENHPDIAVAIIDVIMETDKAGLDLIEWIRDELKNRFIRIILRTGQPGSAPEELIIQKYDVNDYKDKTELTSIKLKTTVAVAVRGYRDLVSISRNNRGLEKIVEAAGTFWSQKSFDGFVNGAVNHLGSLFSSGEDNSVSADTLAIQKDESNVKVVSATGQYSNYIGKTLSEIPDNSLQQIVDNVVESGESILQAEYYAAFLQSSIGLDSVLIFKSNEELDDPDKAILKAYTSNVGLALENLALKINMDSVQREIIYLLGELVEKRSKETGNHVRRVSKIVALVAKTLSFDQEVCERWELGASLHDIGKIAIPDSILNKPEKLTEDEFEIIKQHTTFGFELLRYSHESFLMAAAQIAHYHHEKWDGSGYPENIMKDTIPIEARITTVADIFDALTHKRIYKKSWSVTEAFDFISEQSGIILDPEVVASFLANRTVIEKLMSDYPD
jgi:response regulator RpfG family c-di-GMP phosphodiesterase